MENESTLGAKGEDCPSCADNGIKRSRDNGRIQIMVPNDPAMDQAAQFTAAQQNEIAQILASQNLRQGSETPPFRSQAGPSFATMRPMAPEAPTIDSPSRIPTGSFTLADAGYGELICAEQSVQDGVELHTLNQTNAKDVLPGGMLAGGYGLTGQPIPGAPGKWQGPIYIDPELVEYLEALATVLKILRGEPVWPFFGGRDAGMFPGWTYIVTPDGGIILRPWKRDPTTGQPVPPIPMPPKEDMTKCRASQLVTLTPEYNDGNKHPLLFCRSKYEEIEREQQRLRPQGKFAVVVECDGDVAVVARGECIGPCPPSTPMCWPRYVNQRWDDEIKPFIDTKGMPEPSMGEDLPPGTVVEFGTRVLCECQEN